MNYTHAVHRYLKALLAVATFVPSAVAAVSCASLGSLSLPEARITSAQSVAAGDFTPPPGAGPTQPIHNLPAFCRVAVTLAPSNDSDIKIEVWMPASGWNGKFQAVGNGGWSGAIGYSALASAITRGYASASTDTGHTGGSAEFALGHPEKLIDFAYRSEHEMTVKAKALVAAFYGSGPKLSYWNGCSSGGKQGLKEAQKYPEDYNGVIAGAPANNWVALLSSDMMSSVALLKDPASRIPPAQTPAPAQSGGRGVRCSGRRQRRSHRRSHQMPFRSRGPVVQGTGNGKLSHSGASGSGEETLWSLHQSTHP